MCGKEKLNKLPNGWVWTTLEELGIIVSGGTPSTEEPQFWGGEIPWITPSDLSNFKEKYISNGARSLTKVGLDNSSARILPKGSILFSSRAPIGYVAIANTELSTNQGFKNVVITESLYSDYIYYYLKSIKHVAEALASGTTFLELSGSKFGKINIPLPPIEEQYKIISRVEELNSALDDSERTLFRVERNLNSYKQAILKSAFTGDIKKSIKGNWKNCEVGDIFNFIGGGTPSKKKPEYWNGEIKWASVKDVKDSFISDTIDKITKLGLENSSSNLASNGDIILVTRISPGRVSIVKSELAINQDLKIIRPLNINEVNYKFTYYLFLYLQNEIVKLSKGTTVKGIRINELKTIKISYPDLDTQDIIVAELDKKYSLSDDLSYSSLSCIKRIETLRHVIFRKAFKGELIESVSTNDSVKKLLLNVKKEKELFIKSLENIKKTTPKIKLNKRTLKQIINEDFLDMPFSLIDIKKQTQMSDKQLKKELFQLLENESIASFFDENSRLRLYKVK
ncbi:restriction endonuclease subunit S [Flavobacterium johnsoniae]|uniref:restriction endonuclease subunit S n=1 Tax=Flavobacterium johnsoniae TaxID=986 RepID=UPI003D995709